ncbi:hypothetical protein GCM10023332_11430 [Luteimonas vadosa]|uniref:Lipoprotein n=1 Tax=Luteimonas vadosa TaxID=1165507 RepID=A0ABP9DYP4_9GAMM
MDSRVALIVLCVAIAACSTASDTRLESLDELGDRLARTICSRAPVKVESVPNPHVEGQIDRLETRQCASGSSTLYIGETTSDPNGLAVAVNILAEGSGLPPLLEIGHPIEHVMQSHGPPQEQAPGSVTYGLGIEGIDTITIRHEAGRITSIQWAWLVD